MASSGTTTFESSFYIDDVITEAYERIGRFDYSGNDIKTARRSLNIMFQEWGNRGLHFWEVKNNSITLVDGQSTYTMYRSATDGTSDATAVYGVDDILEAVYRNSSAVDFSLTPGSSEAGNFINYYYVSRIQDSGAYSNTADVPYRFVPCMVSGLAYYLAQKFKPELVQQMKLLYEDELKRALEEDGSSSSTFITPKSYYPNV